MRSKLSTITALTPSSRVPFAAQSREEPVPYSLPPMAFRLVVVLGEDVHECVYYHKRGLGVPERFLRILDAIPADKKTPALRKFVKANREV